MIYNATLLRLDPPAPAPQGAPVSVMCAVTPLTAQQAELGAAQGWSATSVVYLPARSVPSPGPVVGGHAQIQPAGAAEPALYPIVHVVQRAGRTLSHVQVFLGNPT